MCRYHRLYPYRTHFVCFDCTTTFKYHHGEPLCPHCGKVMVDLGEDFQPPKKNNKQQWEKVRALYRMGVTFHSCGCVGPGYRPRTIQELKRSVRRRDLS